MALETDLNLKETELRLGVPGSYKNEEEDTALSLSKTNKRASPEAIVGCNNIPKRASDSSPAPKAQIVGWPPVRSYRKNNLGSKAKTESESGIYVKVSMDGAPYLRKIDLRLYKGYEELIKALENMFSLTIGAYYEREGYKGSEYAPAYDDKDGDLMLVGDVPWEMFVETCKRLRIIRGSDAKGLAVLRLFISPKTKKRQSIIFPIYYNRSTNLDYMILLHHYSLIPS